MNKLKNIALTIAATILLLSSNDLYAQAFRWEFGAEGGAGIRSIRLNMSNLDSIKKSEIGFVGGLTGQYNINEMLSLKLAAEFERKGAKFESATGKEQFNYDYLSIPLLLKTKFGNKIKFFINAGPFVAILLKAKQKSNNTNMTPDADITDLYKKTEIGISGGAGVIIPVGRTINISFEVRDNFGLTDILKEGSSTNGTTVKTNNVNLMAGISFLLGKRSTVRR